MAIVIRVLVEHFLGPTVDYNAAGGSVANVDGLGPTILARRVLTEGSR
jgi:hypothetical protein